jgi:hypothetical protein
MFKRSSLQCQTVNKWAKKVFIYEARIFFQEKNGLTYCRTSKKGFVRLVLDSNVFDRVDIQVRGESYKTFLTQFTQKMA